MNIYVFYIENRILFLKQRDTRKTLVSGRNLT